MSEEIKKQISKRMENFVPGVVQGDSDSWIFNNETMLKIQELYEEFPEALIYEVLIKRETYPFNRPSMNIDGFQASRILNNTVKQNGMPYAYTKPMSMELITSLGNELGKLFDELVVPAVDPNLRLVKNVDEWIKRVHEMKEKYGTFTFQRMYEIIAGIRSLMWGEGYEETEAAVEYTNRQEKEIETMLALDASRRHQSGFSEELRAQIVKATEEINKPDDLCTRGSLPAYDFENDLHIGVGRGLRLSTSRNSGGDGYDISTNGSRHKKVVTGKAGNRYPVAKRRGVK